MKIRDFVHNRLGLMSKERFQIAYDGPAMREGTMDVYDLAPALLSLGDLIRDVNRFLNQDRATVSVQVESDFERGSFEIALLIDQNLIDTAKAVLFAGAIIDASGLTQLIFGDSITGKVITGILKLYKALNGRKPDSSKIVVNHADNVTVIENLHVDSQTAQLYFNDIVRNDLDKVVRPVAKPGIDKLEVRKNDAVIEELGKENIPERLLEASTNTEREESLSNNREAILSVVTANFEKGKWKFSDGTAKFNADVQDVSFRDKLDRREIGFFKGDALRVQLRTVQTVKSDGKLHTKYVIEQVVEYKPAPKPARLLGQ